MHHHFGTAQKLTQHKLFTKLPEGGCFEIKEQTVVTTTKLLSWLKPQLPRLGKIMILHRIFYKSHHVAAVSGDSGYRTLAFDCTYSRRHTAVLDS